MEGQRGCDKAEAVNIEKVFDKFGCKKEENPANMVVGIEDRVEMFCKMGKIRAYLSADGIGQNQKCRSRK